MSRTQIYLGEEERALLDHVARATGAARSEPISRAILSAYRRELTKEEKLRALERSFGSWKDRRFTGAEYVDSIRGDLEERLRRLGLE